MAIGPGTVREIQQVLIRTRKAGYTTVLKLLQIMTKKKLVVRDESTHAHIYEANCSRQNTQKRLVNDLMRKAFGGSSLHLASTLFSDETLSKPEFERLRNEILTLRNNTEKNGDD